MKLSSSLFCGVTALRPVGQEFVARFCAVLIALAVVCLTSCSKSTDNSPTAASTKSGIKIGMSFQELDNPYFSVMKEALDEAGKSIGAELFVTDARHDITKQINDIEDLVQKGIDILKYKNQTCNKNRPESQIISDQVQ